MGIVLCLLAGCFSPAPVRIGAPLRTPAGEPRNDCEREGWLDVTPVRATELTRMQGSPGGRTVEVPRLGYGIYPRAAGADAMGMPVAVALRRIGDEQVADARERRFAGVHRRTIASVVLQVGGGVLMAAAAAAFLGEPEYPSGPAAFGLGLGGLVTWGLGLFLLPSSVERAEVTLREQTLQPDEDDLARVLRRLDHHHRAVRARCNGSPPPPPFDAEPTDAPSTATPPPPPESAPQELPTTAMPWRR